MSRKKSNKVKDIIRRNNAVRNIVTIIIGGLFLICCGFLTYILAVSSFYAQIADSDKDMLQLVSVINSSWDDQQALDEQILAQMDGNRAFSQVLLIDDNFDVIRQIGEIRRVGVETPVTFNRYHLVEEAVRNFKKTGIYRGITIPYLFDFDFSQALKLVNPENMAEDMDMLEWAHSDAHMNSDWVIYRTDIAGVNVCVRYVMIWDELRYHQFVTGFEGCVFFAFLFLISGFFFAMSIIRRRRYGDKLIYTDPVTGGNNRDFFINKALKGMKKRHQYAVVQFRLEKYSNYCTAYGLKQGERLLEMIYWDARSSLGKNERIAHLENADFALLLQYADREQLENRLKEMADAFNGSVKRNHLVFAAGLYPVTTKKADMTEILTAAGLALAKAENQNANIAWFNEEMKQEQLWERRIEDDMGKALARHEFQVYLQPKYSTKNKKLAAAEALVRWVHPELRFITPGKFIPIFERNGFILQLDDYMLREIAKLQAGWLREGRELVPISVNVSRAHFSMDDLAEHICSIVDEYRVPHQYIELELTESAFFDDKKSLLSTVKKLKKYGFRISMDDFGAGYSSLNSLKELPLDIIKLDAEFFRSIDDVKRANDIVGDTIRLAKKLGMEIVAEGIETREQVDFLAAQNCDLIQGFYFAKPLPVSEFVQRAYGANAN